MGWSGSGSVIHDHLDCNDIRLAGIKRFLVASGWKTIDGIFMGCSINNSSHEINREPNYEKVIKVVRTFSWAIKNSLLREFSCIMNSRKEASVWTLLPLRTQRIGWKIWWVCPWWRFVFQGRKSTAQALQHCEQCRLADTGKLYQKVPHRFFSKLTWLNMTAISSKDFLKVVGAVKHLEMLNIGSCMDISEQVIFKA